MCRHVAIVNRPDTTSVNVNSSQFLRPLANLMEDHSRNKRPLKNQTRSSVTIGVLVFLFFSYVAIRSVTNGVLVFFCVAKRVVLVLLDVTAIALLYFKNDNL